MSMGSIGGGIATAVVGNALSGGGGGGGGGARAAEFKVNSNPYFSAHYDRWKGMDDVQMGATGILGDLQSGLFQDAGQFNDMARNNDGADLARTLGMDFLGGLGAFDPEEIAQMQFDILDPILADRQMDDRYQMEDRLFQQGRLGSTAGANEMGALYDSQEDARRKLLADSFGLGLQAQSQQFGLGSGLLQLDPTLRGMFQSLGGNALRGGLDIQTSANNVFNTAVGAAGGASGGQAGFSPMDAVGAGMLNSGVDQMSKGLQGLFQPSQTLPTGYYTSGNPHR